MSSTNGNRVLVSMKYISFIAAIIFTAGGGWVRLNAQESKLDDLESTAINNSQSVALLQQSIDVITDDVQEIKMEQKQQKQILTDIYIEVKRKQPET